MDSDAQCYRKLRVLLRFKAPRSFAHNLQSEAAYFQGMSVSITNRQSCSTDTQTLLTALKQRTALDRERDGFSYQGSPNRNYLLYQDIPNRNYLLYQDIPNRNYLLGGTFNKYFMFAHHQFDRPTKTFYYASKVCQTNDSSLIVMSYC